MGKLIVPGYWEVWWGCDGKVESLEDARSVGKENRLTSSQHLVKNHHTFSGYWSPWGMEVSPVSIIAALVRSILMSMGSMQGIPSAESGVQMSVTLSIMSEEPSSFQNEMQTSCMQYPIVISTINVGKSAIQGRTVQTGVFQEIRMDGNGRNEVSIVRNATRALIRIVQIATPRRSIGGRIVRMVEEIQFAIEQTCERNVDISGTVNIRRLCSSDVGLAN